MVVAGGTLTARNRNRRRPPEPPAQAHAAVAERGGGAGTNGTCNLRNGGIAQTSWGAARAPARPRRACASELSTPPLPGLQRLPRLHRRARAVAAALLVLGVAALPLMPGSAEAQAAIDVPPDWALVPDGLGVGDEFRLMFVTSTKRDGATYRPYTYDAHVGNAAAAGHSAIQAYSAHFRALVCTTLTTARDNTGTTYTSTDRGVPIYWLDGPKVADDYADFYDGTWDHANPYRNEHGTAVTDASGDDDYVGTGCNDNGTRAARNLLNHSSPKRSEPVLNNGLDAGASFPKNEQVRFYALSAVMRVKNVQENATLSALGLAVVSGRKRFVGRWPWFSPAITEYRAWVDQSVASLEVTPTTAQADATVAYLDGSDAAITDTDTMTPAFDFPLSPGANVIKIKVTTQNGMSNRTYAVTVVRPAPRVSLEPGSLLSATITVGQRVAAVGVWGDKFAFGAITRSWFRVAGERYRLATVLLMDAPFSYFSANTVGACFFIYGRPPDRVRNQLTLRLGEHDFRFSNATRTREMGEQQCYQWPRPPGLTWAFGDTARLKLFYGSVATGKPVINGAAQIGGTLTAVKGTLRDEDGLRRADRGDADYTYRYQWIQVDDGTETHIEGETGRSYAPRVADVGKMVKVQVRFRDDEGNDEAHTSDAILLDWAGDPPLAAGEGEQIWSATLTPKSLSGNPTPLGCGTDSEPTGKRCSEAAVLTDNTVAVDDVEHTIRSISVRNGEVRVTMDRTDLVRRSTLIVGETALPVSSGLAGSSMIWRGTGIAWTEDVPVSLRLLRPTEAQSLTATLKFYDRKEVEGGKIEYRFDMQLSRGIANSFRDVRDHSFIVTNATVTKAKRVSRTRQTIDGRRRLLSDHWRMTAVADTAEAAVSVSLPVTECGTQGAICTVGGDKLEAEQTLVLNAPAPLTISIRDATAREEDEIIFFDVRLSRPSSRQVEFDYRTTTEGTATAGTDFVARNKRSFLLPGEVKRQIYVLLSNDAVDDDGETVIVELTAAQAVDTSGTLDPQEVTIAKAKATGTIDQSPARLKVWDARVQEAADATVDFTVTMSRAESETVTVAYATSNGSATAGEDYTAKSDTLTFAPGDRAKTVSVEVLDDAIDEGEETFWLTLSSPSGGDAVISRAKARGTIENDDPLPGAWLARFGRTIASQAVDAIGARMAGGGGTQVTVGGQALALSGEPVPANEDEMGAVGALKALAETDGEPGDVSHGMTGREVLLGSAFQLSAGGEAGAPAWTAWGRFATGGFDAEEDGVAMDGRVTTGFLGADVEAGRWLAGVALGLSEGEGDFALTEGEDRGTVQSTLSAAYPYARLSLAETVDVWGLAGYGTGELTLTQHPETARARRYETDLSMRVGAAGARGEVLSPGEPGDLRVTVRSDAFRVRTTSEAVTGLMASEADASRVRLIVEGSRDFEAGAGTLTPALELGVRHDGGDAETGTGIEAGASLRYAGAGFSAAGRMRMLLAHEETGYEEWGAAGAVRIDPGASGRGLSFTLAPAWGTASSGAGRLWSLADARGLAPEGEFEAGRSVEAEVGYGLVLGHAPGVLTPYAGLTMSDGARAWRTGARWQLGPGAALALEGTRREASGGDAPAEHGVMLRGALGW